MSPLHYVVIALGSLSVLLNVKRQFEQKLKGTVARNPATLPPVTAPPVSNPEPSAAASAATLAILLDQSLQAEARSKAVAKMVEGMIEAQAARVQLAWGTSVPNP